jgi:hypothetical protein
MRCVGCGSEHLKEFPSETAIHFSGLENLDKPHVLVFPKVIVCLDCGFAGFNIAEPELGRLGSAMARNESLPTKRTPLRSRSVAQDCD